MEKQSLVRAMVLTFGIGAGTVVFAHEPAKPAPMPPEGQPAVPSKAQAATDEAFARKAAAGGQAEVELAALAQEKTSNNQVKMLAQRIATDHKKANDELMSITKTRRMDIDPKPTAEQAATKAKLEKLSGAQFDRAYVDQMEKDHQKTIKEFEQQATMGADPQLKAFASKVLPDLKAHLKMTTDAKRALTSTSQ